MDAEKIILGLKNNLASDFEVSFGYSRVCSNLLRHTITAESGRKIIIHVLDNWKRINDETKTIWGDIIESAGFYPYLNKKIAELDLDTSSKIRTKYHESSFLKDVYFHEEQKRVNELLNGDKNLILSAPTSFGKSLLIEEIVASKKNKNIVIIQPTLALLDETRKKMKKYQDYYKIIVRTSQEPSKEKGNLFLLTAERVMEYQNLPKIDLLILDEFYKLSKKRDDERSGVLNNAFHYLIEDHSARFYLLGPNIDGISPGFAEKYNAIFYRTNYSLVDAQIINLESECPKDNTGKELELFNLLSSLKNQTIIYCSSPERARGISLRFLNYLVENKMARYNKNFPLIEWVEKNISKEWKLVDCLKNSIGFHDGALQKHITSSIIKYFNLPTNNLKFLFCTSTIIEGVNTSAKNIVIFDESKGGKAIDFFDYSNIVGRAGRMMIHYTGDIYNFNKIPEKEELIVDIPFFEQNPIEDEILIHLKDKDIHDKESKQYEELNKIPKEERDLFKRNGVSVKGQKEILDYFEKNYDKKFKIKIRNVIEEISLHEMLEWNRFPKYHQLEFIIELCWKYLKKRGESLSVIKTHRQLTYQIMTYSINKNIHEMLDRQYKNYLGARASGKQNWEKKYVGMGDGQIFEEAIRDTFQFLKHWVHYKTPKWIRVINELQKYFFQKKGISFGNYAPYANGLENDFVRENMALLIEYGVPKSAIGKIQKFIGSGLSEDEVVQRIRKKKIYNNENLLLYEKEKIKEFL